MNGVSDFINQFKSISPSENVTETFSFGACYWFTKILCERFTDENAELCYAPIDNHFVARINNKIYDIIGDVTGQYNIIRWTNFDDELEKERIENNCINFLKEEDIR